MLGERVRDGRWRPAKAILMPRDPPSKIVWISHSGDRANVARGLAAPFIFFAPLRYRLSRGLALSPRF